jgi:hypothetical protein
MRATLVDFIKQNPTLTIAGASAALASLKILNEAHFDVTTAQEILRTSGTGSILLGASLSLLTLLGVGLGSMILLVAWIRSGEPLMWASVTAVVLFLIGVFVLPFFLVGYIVAAAVLYWVFHRRSTRRADRQAGAAESKRAALIFSLTTLGAIYLIYAVIAGTPFWLPKEVVQLENDERYVGYVLGQREGWTRILLSEDRSILQVRESDIEDRFNCEDQPDGWRERFRQWRPFDTGADYPDCDDYRQER